MAALYAGTVRRGTGRIRAVLVPATDLYLALRENVDLDFVGPHEAVVKGGEE